MTDGERAEYWEHQARLFKAERDEQAKTIQTLDDEAQRKWREARYWRYQASKYSGPRAFARLERDWLKRINSKDEFMS